MKIAQIQMHVSADKAENIRHACDLVRSAGDIDLAVLPEMFCCRRSCPRAGRSPPSTPPGGPWAFVSASICGFRSCAA